MYPNIGARNAKIKANTETNPKQIIISKKSAPIRYNLVVIDPIKVMLPKITKNKLRAYPKENLLNELLETMIIYLGFL